MSEINKEDINVIEAGELEESSISADLPDKGKFIVDEQDDEVILHKIGADLKKLYLEPTSSCNLQCITCLRQQWPE